MAKKLKVLVSVLLLLIGWTIQAQVTTSSISGKVMADGEPQVGASVVARHIPTGTVYGSTCNKDGNFTIQGMKSGGPYMIEISFLGYKSVQYDQVRLALGETFRINANMVNDTQTLGEVQIVESKSNSFNNQITGAATSVSREKINNMPTINRGISDVVRLTPQATVSGGAISFAGTNNRYNSFQIDGSINNDVFGLSSSGTNGGQTDANPISLDAIQEMQVVIAPFDVRQGGFTGGGINAITKSGTNEIKGSVYGYYNNQDFIGTTAGDIPDGKSREKLSEQSTKTYGGTLGLPILKNKLFFFGNIEQTDNVYPSSYNISSGNSNITADEASRVEGKVKSLTGGYNGGGYDPQNIDKTSTKFLGRLDWNINSKNKFSLRYSYLKSHKTTFSNTANLLRFNDNGISYNNTTQSLVAELNSTLSDKWFNEARVSYSGVKDRRTYFGQPMPQVVINLDANRNIYVGSEPYSSANSLDQSIIEFTDNATLYKGNHTFTFGTHNEFYYMKNLFIGNNFGSYTYSSLDDFESVGTASEKAPKYYDYAFSREDVTGSNNWAPSFNAAQIGFYAQDKWNVNTQLELTYGIRMDMPLYLDKPSENIAFNQTAIAKEYNVATNQMPKSTPLFSPRVGFRYDLDENKSSLLRGGFGIFTGRAPFVWISNSFSNSGVEYNKVSLNGSNMANAIADGFQFQIDPEKQYYNTNTPSSEVDVVDRNFKAPQVLRGNLAYEKKFENEIKASLEGVYTKNINNVLFKNLIVQESGLYLNNGGDQRPLYEKVIDPATGYAYSNNYTSVVYLTNTSKGYTYNFTAKVEKDFDFGLSTMVAYTYGESKALNDGTSSQAYSNWKYNENYSGPNNPELSYADFHVPHHIVASLSYRKEYAKNFATSVGLFYNGQSGPNYSLVYFSRANVNGDAYDGNDVIYIPTDQELSTMNFADIINSKTKEVITPAEDQRAALGSWINSNKDLKNKKGDYIDRNSMMAPFVNNIDLHLAQDFNFNVAGRKNTLQFTFDILNVGNLINRNWGLVNSTSYSYSPITISSVDPSTKTPTFQFTEPKGKNLYSQNNIYSRWRAQVGLRYIF